jgi:hypothetical protein
VQFSTASPGKAKFRPDHAWPAKCLLHKIYYAEREYREKHHRWATSLQELGLANLHDETIVGVPKLETTESLFECTVETNGEAGKQRWHIRQDSKIWKD